MYRFLFRALWILDKDLGARVLHALWVAANHLDAVARVVIVCRVRVELLRRVEQDPVQALPHVHAVRDVPVKRRVKVAVVARAELLDRHVAARRRAVAPVPVAVHVARVLVVGRRQAGLGQPRVQHDAVPAAARARVLGRVAAVAVRPGQGEAGRGVGAVLRLGDDACVRVLLLLCGRGEGGIDGKGQAHGREAEDKGAHGGKPAASLRCLWTIVIFIIADVVADLLVFNLAGHVQSIHKELLDCMRSRPFFSLSKYEECYENEVLPTAFSHPSGGESGSRHTWSRVSYITITATTQAQVGIYSHCAAHDEGMLQQ